MIGLYVIVKVVANSFKIKDFPMKAVRNFNKVKVQFRRQMISLM